MSIFDDMELMNRIAMMPSGWQLIESAPKDGTPLLACDGDAMTTVFWWAHGGGYWSLVEPGLYAEDGEWAPTHWMPLPPPPNTTSSDTS